MRTLPVLAVLLSLAPVVSGQTGGGPPLLFEVTRVTGPPGCDAPQPMAINNRGQIALICSSGGDTRSFLWDRGSLVALGEFEGNFVRHEAYDLNDSGTVAGSSWGMGFPAAAWQWSSGTFTPLGALGGSNANAIAINGLGQQTGWAHTAPPIASLLGFAFLYDDGRMINLGELPEANASEGFGINDLGQVAAISMKTGESFFRGVIADTRIGMHSVGTLGGLESDAQDLNNAGEVVGRSDTGRIADDHWAFHAYVWQDGVMTDLRPLPGDEFSSATGINQAGDAVGWSRSHWFAGSFRAVLWVDHVAVDLNSVIRTPWNWALNTTYDINDAGQIVGTGLLDGTSATFLLTPIPTPSSAELVRGGRGGDTGTSPRTGSLRSGPSSASSSHPCRRYRITDLGALPGGKEAWAFGLNDAGQVASTAQYDRHRRFYHAVLWDHGFARDLGQLSTDLFHSFATAVNRHGHVVGASPKSIGFGQPDRAFQHDGSGMTDLGALTPGATSFAFDINDRGHVVGYSGTGVLFDGKEVSHAVLWSNGQITDLGTLGGKFSRAHAVNDSLRIVGSSLVDGGPTHAFVWSGSMVDLGTLGGASSEAWDVDDLGRIVGVSDDVDGARRAFLVENGLMRDLGALPGARASEAFSLNESGEIVGSSWIPGDGPHAVLWDAGQPIDCDDGELIDLNDVVALHSPWSLQVARGINEAGQIVGYGRLRGSTRAFLLTPLTR